MGKYIVLVAVITVIISFLVIEIKKLLNHFKQNQINKYLKSITIDNINSLSGHEFEEFLYYLFLNFGFDVDTTPKSHDYGADLILKVGNKKAVIQCKLYTNHNIGISSVQEVYSSIKYYGADMGIVITNSMFTKNSINLANSTNILLWDKNMLIKLLNFKENDKKLFKQAIFYSLTNEN